MSRPNMWFRMYAEVVDDPKVQQLPDKLFKVWVNLLCVATRNGGKLPPKDQVAFKLRVTEDKVDDYVETFLKRDLFDVTEDGIVPHNWNARQYKSDVSSDRVKRFRDKERNVSETPTEQSIAETEAKASVSRPAPKPRRTRLAKDWQPSPDDYAHAVREGLQHSEIAADIIEFIAYWTGDEPRDPLKTNWSATYRKHVTAWTPGIIANRTRAGRSKGNAGSRASATSIRDQLRAEAGLQPERHADPLRTEGLDQAPGISVGPASFGTVIDADFTVRSDRPDDGIAAPDTAKPGSGGGPTCTGENLHQQDGELSGGRGSAGDDDAIELQPVVALVAGAEGEIRTAHVSAPNDAGGDYGDIHAFLDRRVHA